MSKTDAVCEIRNELGLHLRAAATFVKLAEQFSSDIELSRDSTSANGKSIIALVTLAAAQGTQVRVSAEGPDAEAAVEALTELIRDRFGEEK